MDSLSPATSVIAVIQLSASIVNICGSYIWDVKNAREDIVALQGAVAGLEGVLQQLKELLQGPTGARLSTSHTLARDISKCLFVRWRELTKDIEKYKSSFTLSLQVDQTALITGIAQTNDVIDRNLDIGKLPVAHGAEFGSYMDQHEDECLEGTRAQLRQQIAEWSVTPQGKCIFWLKVMAGTGKSTVSRTVAKSFKEANLLGASFFFKRGEGDRGNAIKMFPTITRQLTVNLPQLLPGVRKAINDNPDIGTKSLREQFNKLLLQPLLSLKSSAHQIPTRVIVIDALDECEQDNDIRTILLLLPQLGMASNVHLRIFLTSRPELSIRLGFLEIADRNYQDLALHEIPAEVTEHDIFLFINHRLLNIKRDRSLPVDWPEDTDIQTIVMLSTPLFIFAATMCRIFEDPQWDPVDSLAEVLSHRNDASKLDGTYLPVLNQLLTKQSEKQKKQLVQEFQEVVGTIVMLQSPLSIISLSRLINLPERMVSLRLNSLHSVLSVPDDANLPVRLFHLSFRDFLINSETREKTPFWVNEEDTHQKLAKQCLAICHSLTRNLCGLPSDGTPRVYIDRQTIDHYLSPELQYSCRYWVHHLVNSKDLTSATYDALSFLEEHFLHWVEAMSILGLASEIVEIINLLQSFEHRHKNHELSEFLQDAKRFVLRNGQIADDVPLQIYCSGLVFAPRQSIVRGKLERELPDWLCRLPEVEEAWSAELQTFESHSDPVQSVSFTRDGRLMASGSSDNTVRLWDPVTGTLQHTLDGHSGWVWSVTFSLDGRLLASASFDQIVKLWNPATGALQHTLMGHSSSVWSVAFSPDSHLLASSSSDNTIKLWDPATGTPQRTLEGHTDWVLSVAFSPDGRLLASGSSDQTVKLWVSTMGALQNTLKGHSGSVRSVAFSLNNQLLASGSSDNTVKLWDFTTGTLQHTLESHVDWVLSVAFSPNSRLLASGSSDNTVKLWDPAKGTLLHTLKGHSGYIWSVAFSPSGRLLASGSSDNTVKLWDPTMNDLQHILKDHSGPVRSVSFTRDGQLMASSSSDNTVKLWDFATGTLLHTLEGHSGSVRSAAFSYNGGLLASGSDDQIVKLWNPATGALQNSLKGHWGSVRSVAFSPNDQLLASGSSDNTIKLWNPATGVLQHTLEGHTGSVLSVTFSPDGRLLASGSSVAFSPYGQLLEPGSTYTTVKLWDPATGTLQHTLEGHSGSVQSVAFSFDGRLLASSSSDETVKFWDAATGALRQTLNVKEVITSLEFSKDGSHLNTNLGSLTIRSWCDKHTCNTPNTDANIFLLEGQWVTLGGEKVLWLPPEHRPHCSAVKDNTLILGHASGRISFIGFMG
ncbi:NACHT and WD40 domain protein [Aspergillus alliaceus]|uniref:WD40 repeat-containing protein SMU1 n=1 Tax=Petromyces alliaceus TaxID=209559 RepID=A0A5N7BXB7_PETAA|nr:NACHT and WD40 domain protein [Aspergillus alliaceus]